MYSRGSRALGLCDRCGLTWLLKELREEVQHRQLTGMKVCPDCFDGDHPQNFVGENFQPEFQALWDPRPDSGAATSRRLMSWDPVGVGNLEMRGQVGTVTVVIT